MIKQAIYIEFSKSKDAISNSKKTLKDWKRYAHNWYLHERINNPSEIESQ